METDANCKSVLFSTFPLKENGNGLAIMYYLYLCMYYWFLFYFIYYWCTLCCKWRVLIGCWSLILSKLLQIFHTIKPYQNCMLQTNRLVANLITKTFLNLTRKEMKNVIFDQFSLNSILTMIFAIPFELYQIPKCSEI